MLRKLSRSHGACPVECHSEDMAVIISAKCAKCNDEIRVEVSIQWISIGSVPALCNNCGSVVMIKTPLDCETSYVKQEQEIEYIPKTILPINTKVIIENKDHSLHGWAGEIIDKDYLHYRIRFTGRDSIWVPYTWVKKKNLTNQHFDYFSRIFISS